MIETLLFFFDKGVIELNENVTLDSVAVWEREDRLCYVELSCFLYLCYVLMLCVMMSLFLGILCDT